MKLQIITALVLASASAFAGDNGGGTINCISDSGRTKVYGGAGVDYNGFGPASLTIEIDGAKILLNAERPVNEQSVLVDFVNYKNKVSYEAVIKRAFVHSSGADGLFTVTDTVLKLISVKGSFKAKGADKYEFLADLPAYGSLDPRTAPDLKNIDLGEKKLNKDVQVKCLLDVGV